jgi:Protein of unknown function (DUF1573)
MKQNESNKLSLPCPPQKRMVVVAVLLAIALVGWGILEARAFQIAGLQEGSASEQPAEALQRRVHEFYGLLQTQQVSRAEQYVTKESRELLRDQVGKPFLGFRVVSATVNPDGKSGNAVVELNVMMPFSPAPVPIQRNSQWEIEDGEWRVMLVEAPPVNTGDMLALKTKEAEKPEELKFVGHTFGLGVMKPGEVKEARYPFENVTDHVVTIKSIETDCDCLKNKTEKLVYKPGEKGEVVVDFDSTNYEYAFLNTMVVTTSPGDVKSYLRIGAQVVPRAIAFPDKEPEAAKQ